MSKKSYWQLFKDAFNEWNNDSAWIYAAALSFYTFFSLPPLLTIIISLTGLFFGKEAVQEGIMQQISNLLGHSGAQMVQDLISRSQEPLFGTWAAVVGTITLLIGALAVFIQLQTSLNIIWNAQGIDRKFIWEQLRKYLLSFGIVISAAFLLIVSLVVNAVLASLNKYLSSLLPEIKLFWSLMDTLISFAVITVLFALIFKILPDVPIEWRDVWIGAGITSILFNIGRYLIGLYLGQANLGETYGAAASLVIILLWIYYSSQILFYGAEFTKVYAKEYGSHAG